MKRFFQGFMDALPGIVICLIIGGCITTCIVLKCPDRDIEFNIATTDGNASRFMWRGISDPHGMAIRYSKYGFTWNNKKYPGTAVMRIEMIYKDENQTIKFQPEDEKKS